MNPFLTFFLWLFAAIGVTFTVIVVSTIIFEHMDEWNRKRKRKKESLEFKKRMGVKPIAPCYCGECVHRDYKGVCQGSKTIKGLRVHESWFCCWGEKDNFRRILN